MQPIYVTYNNKLCVKKSYLSRFLGLTDELLGGYDIVRKRHYSSSALIEFKKLPILMRRLIIEVFGTDKEPNYPPAYNFTAEMVAKVYSKEINKLKKQNIK